MCIRYIYNIPVLGNDAIFPALLEKFNYKYGDEYDLVEAAKKGNKKAKEILSFLWENKCYHYWNYKNKCCVPIRILMKTTVKLFFTRNNILF